MAPKAQLSPREDFPPLEQQVAHPAVWSEPKLEPDTYVEEVVVARTAEAEEAVVPHKVVEMGEDAGVEEKIEQDSRLDSFSRWTASAAALVYAVACLGQLFWGYYAWETEGVGINWNVSDNPQIIVAVCLAFGAAVLWFMRSVTGRALALVPLGFALYQFLLWSGATTELKTNLAAEGGTQPSGIQSLLYGAGWPDLVALAVIIVLLPVGIYRLVKWAGASRPKGEATSVPQFKHAAR